jgi:hypothetical protein
MALSKIDADGVSGLQAALTATTTVPSEGGAVNTNLVQGLCKALLLFNQLSGTATSVRTMNIASLVDGANGMSTVSFTSSFDAVDYCHLTGAATDGGNANCATINRDNSDSNATTSSMPIVVQVSSTTTDDNRDFNSIGWWGDLA